MGMCDIGITCIVKFVKKNVFNAYKVYCSMFRNQNTPLACLGNPLLKMQERLSAYFCQGWNVLWHQVWASIHLLIIMTAFQKSL